MVGVGGLALGGAGCEKESDEGPECGDGVREGGEQCDGADLGGETCASQVEGSTGQLACDPVSCTFDTTACVLASCGDGEVEGDEVCDCGTDPDNLPVGCDAPNGEPRSSCSVACVDKPACSQEMGETCDPMAVPNECCDDDYGVELKCATLGEQSACLRGCTDSTDCYWSNTCYTNLDNTCYVAFCGPGVSGNDVALNSACQVPGAGSGWCIPLVGRAIDEDPTGICIESGTLIHGDTCDTGALDTFDRSEDVCADGLCLGASGSPTGTCAQFCDWEIHYDRQVYGDSTPEPLACPGAAACLPEAVIDPSTGVRSGDVALCRDDSNLVTCSLVTNQVLDDPNTTCASHSGFTDGRCLLVDFGSAGMGYGSLVGLCGDGDAATKAVWEACDPAHDVCPPGSYCLPEDAFSDPADGTERCVPTCDTEHPDGLQQPCADVGATPSADGTPVCTSWSVDFAPTGSTDADPTRLGLCVRP
jgi:hypothetical protein